MMRDLLLARLREECSIDENGDPVGAEPERGWETGYCAGIRTVYRILRDMPPTGPSCPDKNAAPQVPVSVSLGTKLEQPDVTGPAIVNSPAVAAPITVPREPTVEMWIAGNRKLPATPVEDETDYTMAIWKAMLEASPYATPRRD